MPRARDEPVRLTRIYTRGGDAGETSLGDGSRVSKLDGRIAAFGTVDELNAALGVVLAGVRARRVALRSRADPERAFRRGRRPVRAVRTSRAGCGSSRRWSIASSTTATASTPSCRAPKLRPPGRDRRPRRGSTSRGRSAAAPSARRCARRRARTRSARRGLPQPALGSPLHPRARGQRARGPRRAALEAGRDTRLTPSAGDRRRGPRGRAAARV